MKLFSTLALTSLLTAVSAQRARIGYPPDGTSVAGGSTITVEIVRPSFQSSSQEVAVVLGIKSCAAFPCSLPSDGLYDVLYNGGFNPITPPDAPLSQPHQNFTLLVPDWLPKGPAQLGVAHVTLVGAVLSPFLETFNITLNII